MNDPGLLTFEAPIIGAGGGGAYFDFPFNVEEKFGTKGRVPVVATFDGVEYRGSLAKMGPGCHMLIILKEIRERIGKDIGDTVAVTVRLDTQPRTVELPVEASAALERNSPAKEVYDKLAYSHQREYARWVGEAKQEATRERRAAKMVEMLLAGEKLG